jgi:phosphonoacetaldehyde hydrolase
LNQEEIEALTADELQVKLEDAYQRMWHVGAHYVVDGIWDVPIVLDLIDERLSRGERP